MNPQDLVDLFQDGMMVVMLSTLIIILPGLAVGVCVAVFQAATQINEMTLSFIPRLLVTLVVLLLCSPWLIKELTEYTQHLFAQIPYLIG